MLLPDNIHPKYSIYYNGALVIEELKRESIQGVLDLFQNIRDKEEMSFGTFILSLDWLYLIEVAKINENGDVELCS